MRWTSNMNMQECSFETDCIEIFHLLQNFSDWSSNATSWISEGANFLMRNENWTPSVIWREANRVGDGIAKKAASDGWRWCSVLSILRKLALIFPNIMFVFVIWAIISSLLL